MSQILILNWRRRRGALLKAFGDVIRSRQILLKILSNFIKYNRMGGGRSIWLESLEGGSGRVCPRDEGDGML